MNKLRKFLFALLCLAVPVQLTAAVPRRAAPARDWSKVAVRTPAGTFVQGNPNAPVKLVEYLSLTCPHCAHFEAEAVPALTAKYVRTGQVSYEVRHALRDGFDFAGSLLARCDGPEAFFTTLPRMFAQQDIWFPKAEAWSQIEPSTGGAPDQQLPKLAAAAGFDRMLNLPPARINACLTNHGEQELLKKLAGEAWQRPGFPGTPAFEINGQLRPEIHDWASLDAQLAARLKTPTPLRKTKRS